MNSRTGRPRGRPPEFDRNQVLESLLGVFWAHGYANTGIGQLETATGLRRASLYAAFASKAGLYEAALGHYLRGRLSTALTALASGRTPLEGFLALTGFWEGFMLDMRGRGCFATAVLTGPKVGETEGAAGMAASALGGLRDAVVLRLQDGKPGGDADADFILAFVLGLHLLARTSLPDSAIRNASDRMNDWLRRRFDGQR